MNRWAAALAWSIGLAPVAAAATDIPIHDPAIIAAGHKYYLFGTGPGIVVWSSPDLKNWDRRPPVFATPPAWTAQAVPGFNGSFWAPDISFHQGRYYLYYAVSRFGRNTSVIGLATNVTLDARDPRYAWRDEGAVLASRPGTDDWNAIDPNLAWSEDGVPYLAFGSFWSGLKLVRLEPDLRRPAPGAGLIALASRVPDRGRPRPPPLEAGANAIEAAFIYRHDADYFLFASIDYCCRGAASTYKMIVGRAPRVEGPYLDRNRRPLAEGGSTLLLAGDRRWHGVGHNAAIRVGSTDYLVFHGYDASDPRGRAKLRIEPIRWTKTGWPEVASTP